MGRGFSLVAIVFSLYAPHPRLLSHVVRVSTKYPTLRLAFSLRRTVVTVLVQDCGAIVSFFSLVFMKLTALL